MTSEKAETRRYSTMTKVQLLAQCAEFDASVAKIAMANGINANVVHRWRMLVRGGAAKAATKTGEFITLPLTMAPPPWPPITSEPAVADLHVVQRRNTITMFITRPSSSAVKFALWTRDVLE